MNLHHFLNLFSDRIAPSHTLQNTAFLILSMVLVGYGNNAFARQGDAPKSFSNPVLVKSSIPELVLPGIDGPALRAVDDQIDGRKPLRIALPQDISLELENNGSWQEVPDGFIWRQRIAVPQATDLSLRFSEYHLPQGATLHVIGSQNRYFQGPYTHQDNTPQRQLATPVVPGSRVTVELFVPNRKIEVALKVDRVLAGYRDLFAKHGGPFLEKSGSCNNNVICPVGNPWRNEIRSTAMYVLEDGDICTGLLVGAADGSTTPYFLTANHCYEDGQNPANTVVYWNFESPLCNVAGGGTLNQNQTGMILRASQVIPDVRLMELTQLPNPEFNVYYSGWDRSGVAPNTSVSIHHPNANDKAISFNANPVTSGPDCSINGTTPDTHWVVDNWESGTTEGGSSGAGLFNDTNQVVGTLSGGSAACGNQNPDCFGKISQVWDGPSAAERLRDWLDPGNTGVSTANGFNAARRIEYDSHVGTDLCQTDPAKNNSFWEPGETIDVEVKIIGNDSFTGVTGTLSTTSPGITIVTPTVTYPSLTSGVARSSNTPFKITLDATSGPACFSDLNFQVDVSSNEANPFVLNFSNAVGQSRAPETPWGIPDNSPTGTDSTIQVAEDITITDLNVRVQVTHPAVGDIILTLTSPAGTQILLMDRPGLPLVNQQFGCEDDNFNITFDDAGTVDLETLCPGTDPWYVGLAPPVSPLSNLNGQSTQGMWTLTVTDAAFQLVGEIVDWEIITTPALPVACASCASAQVPDGVVGILDDINGNNVEEVIGFQVDENRNINARVADSDTGAVIRNINFLNPTWNAQGGFGVPPLPGSTTPLVALVAAQESNGLPIVQLKNGNNGSLVRNLFPWSTAWTLLDWGVVPGQAAGGNDAIGTLASRNSDGLMGVELRDPNDNSRIRIIYPLGLGWSAIAGETVNVSGAWAVAVLATRDSDGLTIVQVRDASDGSLIRNVFPLGFGWSPTGEIKRIPDLNGNGVDEIATRMTRDSDGLEIIQIRDTMTNDLVSNVYPIGAGGGGWTTQQFEVVDVAGAIHLGILSRADSSGQILVQTKNALTAVINRNIFFIGPPYEYHDYATLEDFNASNGSELAVFVENTNTGLRLIQVRDASDGSLIRNIFQ